MDSDQLASKNLAKAALVRAIRDFVRYRGSKRPKHQKIFDEVYAWMFVESKTVVQDPLDQLMSFESICDTLEYDPRCLREHVRQLTKEDLDRLGRGNGTVC